MIVAVGGFENGASRGVGDASSVSEAVSKAWALVLPASSLKRDEAFDVAGGDSLGFLRLVHLIEEDLGVVLPLEALSPTHRPSDLADAIHLAMSGARNRQPLSLIHI